MYTVGEEVLVLVGDQWLPGVITGEESANGFWPVRVVMDHFVILEIAEPVAIKKKEG